MPIGQPIRTSEVCCPYGQLKSLGRWSGSAAVSDSRSCTSPVKITSERRTATTTRWPSTTSLVPERASRFPTSGPSSKATTITDCRNLARRACRAPSRHTWATTGCVVVRGVSWMSAAVRNSCAARSPRSTEMRNPASRIKVVAVAHGRDRTFVDRACLLFPVRKKIGESGMPSGFGGEESKPDAKCVRSAAMDLGQLVERVLFVGVESNGGRRHVHHCSTNVLHEHGRAPFLTRRPHQLPGERMIIGITLAMISPSDRGGPLKSVGCHIRMPTSLRRSTGSSGCRSGGQSERVWDGLFAHR